MSFGKPVFKVGDKVKFKVFSRAEAVGVAPGVTPEDHPGWIPSMTDDAVNGTTFEVIVAGTINQDYPKSWIKIENSDGLRWLAIAEWLTHVDAKSEFKCSCDISYGCTCGAFVAEQESKGLVYNKWTKHWNPR